MGTGQDRTGKGERAREGRGGGHEVGYTGGRAEDERNTITAIKTLVTYPSATLASSL